MSGQYFFAGYFSGTVLDRGGYRYYARYLALKISIPFAATDKIQNQQQEEGK
jgi:hypothetical protein